MLFPINIPSSPTGKAKENEMITRRPPRPLPPLLLMLPHVLFHLLTCLLFRRLAAPTSKASITPDRPVSGSRLRAASSADVVPSQHASPEFDEVGDRGGRAENERERRRRRMREKREKKRGDLPRRAHELHET